MKNLFTTLLLACSINAIGQDSAYTPRELSAEDSALVRSYWRKANMAPLFSLARQRYLDSALAIQPWNAYFWQQKGMPLSKQYKHELAQPFLDSAVKYNPKRYLDYRGYMYCVFRQLYRDAIKDLHAAKALNGNSGVMDHPYNFYIGLSHLQLNNFDSCKYYMRMCIDERHKQSGLAADAEPVWTHPLHWFYLSLAEYELTDTTGAVRDMKQCLALNPTFPDAHYQLSYFYANGKMYADALKHAVMADSLSRKGYSMNEDGGRYVLFPYQLNRFYLDGRIDWLKEKLEK